MLLSLMESMRAQTDSLSARAYAETAAQHPTDQILRLGLRYGYVIRDTPVCRI